MTLHRRRFLYLAAGAVALPAVSRIAWAQAYPSRPVRIIVGFGAGGSPDILARLIGQWLSERIGQPFVIENRPGAGTNIATEAVVKAAPDGTRCCWLPRPQRDQRDALRQAQFQLLPRHRAGRGDRPRAARHAGQSVVPGEVSARVHRLCQGQPRQNRYASAGSGTSLHMAGELFKMMAGVDMVHVPYRGAAAALTDLLGGQVQMLSARCSRRSSTSGPAGCVRWRRPGRLAPVRCQTPPSWAILTGL